MAGKGGGGAWKVAYADFVTAMMAFFLVMWICGQDQQVRKAVSYYFNDPYNTSLVGTSKQPGRTGSVAEHNSFGSVPMSEAVALGRGRKSFSAKGEKTPATKLVSDWLHTDERNKQYWEDQARHVRQRAAATDEVRQHLASIDEVAVLHLSKHMRNAIGPEIAGKTTGLQQELLFEIVSQVNWSQIAEDFIAP